MDPWTTLDQPLATKIESRTNIETGRDRSRGLQIEVKTKILVQIPVWSGDWTSRDR